MSTDTVSPLRAHDRRHERPQALYENAEEPHSLLQAVRSFQPDLDQTADRLGARHFFFRSRRLSSRSTASRMNSAIFCLPTSASIRSSASFESRTTVAFMFNGGRPMRPGLADIG
jgi:hypothetical protein